MLTVFFIKLIIDIVTSTVYKYTIKGYTMLKKIIGLVGLLAMLSGCSMFGNEETGRSANKVSNYGLSKSEVFEIYVYAEHINAILYKDKKKVSNQKELFIQNTQVTLMQEKREDAGVQSSYVIRNSFNDWLSNYLFDDDDFEHLVNYANKTRNDIALKLMRKNNGVAQNPKGTNTEMIATIINNVATFYYCDKMQENRVEFFSKDCSVLKDLKGTRQQRRNEVYAKYTAYYYLLNDVK